MKKVLAVILLLALGGAAIFLINSHKTTLKQEVKTPKTSKIRLAYIDIYKVWEIPVTVASEKGLFKKNNLDVEIKRTKDSASKLLIANQADAIFNAPYPSLLASVEGAKLSWIGTLLSDTPTVLVSNKEPKEIKTVITYPRSNPLNKTATIKLLNELNVDINSIQFEEVSTEQIALTSLLEKQVDAVGGIRKSSWLVFEKKNKTKEEPKVLIDTLEKENLRTSAGIITRNDFLKNNKSSLEGFSKALIEATSWTRSNKKEAVSLLAKKLNIKNEEAEIYVNEFIEITNKLDFTPSKKEGEKLLKVASTTNPKAKNYRIEDFISSQISDSLNNSGFLKKINFN